ncbi:MAG TPA: hypothetical protein VE404_00765, partial [Verrucomicrobiae bacterium]|nr:hypothetical protein [Verrucomicrobiae bacterium]
MAKSPSTAAFSSPPAKAAREFTPLVLPMDAPCIEVSRPREHLDGVLDGHRAEALKPASRLDPQVVGLRRDPVDQDQPARIP